MTPKEKAEELVNNFLETIPFADTNVYKDWKKEMKNKAKECALIAVDEMLKLRYLLKKETYFYNQVKKEIKKL